MDANVSEAVPPRAGSPHPDRSVRRRLLFIDDEVALLRAYQRTVGRDHDLLVCDNATEALELLAVDRDFDLILCDLMMPNMDGVAFFHELRRRHGALADRVVFVTGGAFSTESKAFVGRGDVTVVSKPLDLDELFALLSSP